MIYLVCILHTLLCIQKDGNAEEEVVDEDKEALLVSDYDETADDGKTYGKTFVDKFLNDLEKKEHEVVENEMSVTPKSDPAPEQMDKEEKSTPSVISGDEND